MNPSIIKNLKQLANFLRCEEEFLAAYLADDYIILDSVKGDKMPEKIGQTSIIEKLYLRKRNTSNPSYREIYTVRTDTLKSTHKILNSFLIESYDHSSAVHGYVKRRNIGTNAAMHLAKRNLLSIDIANFFESISLTMVQQVFSSIGFSGFASEHLSKLVTLNNFLPMGFNTSPTISNLIVRNMDEQFLKLCGNYCVYTRYADDLYFSSDTDLPALNDLEAIVSSNGFSLNPDKTKYMLRGGKQYVTGLTVFDHIRPRVTKRTKRNLRLELYYMEKYGLLEHVLHQLGYSKEQYDKNYNVASEVNQSIRKFDNRISGWIRFMNSVERPAAQRFSEQYRKVER
ncbi:MAG: reverse transcriptase family protein [Chitinophagaceae bacterium]